jgi:hypothetical protein
MHSIFIAHGPAFKKPEGKKLEPFENIQLCQLMAKILNVQPPAHNGSRQWLNSFTAEYLQDWV